MSLDELPPVVSVADVMRLYQVQTLGSLRSHVDTGRIPPPFMGRPQRWRKSDLVAHIGPVKDSRRG